MRDFITLSPEHSLWFINLNEKFRLRINILNLFAIKELPNLILGKNVTINKINNSSFMLNDSDFQYTKTLDKNNVCVCSYDGIDYAVSNLENNRSLFSKLRESTLDEPLFYPRDRLLMLPNIVNYVKEKTEYTTLGIYLINYLCFIHLFNKLIPYQNKTIYPSDLEPLTSELYLSKKIDLESVPMDQDTPHDLFMRNFYHLVSFGDVFVPTLSRKSLTTSEEVLQRKKELLEKHAHELNDPVVASDIENELIALDKKYLKNDVSYGFYGSDSKKFNVHRKKQFITEGSISSFGTDEVTYDFIAHSLEEGWEKESLPVIVNEARKGINDRAIETAKGGETSKSLLRLFQDFILKTEDCGSTDYLVVPNITEALLKEFINRTIVENGKQILITDTNYKSYIGKTIHLRSLVGCKAKPGGCRICAGKIFKDLGVDAVGIFTLDIGKTFLLESMKSMHGTKTESINIDDVTNYIFDVENV